MESQKKEGGLISKALAEQFKSQFDALQQYAFMVATSKGWWDKECNHGEQLALMHSEISEALEFLRHGNGASDHIPDFTGVEEELADVVIRIMSYAGKNDLRIAQAIIAKMEYNASRDHMHGGKKF